MNIKKILKTYRTFEDYMDEFLQDRESQRLWLETNIGEFMDDGNIEALVDAVDLVIKARGRGTITALAKKLKMDRSNVSEILNGKAKPRLDTVFKLIFGLGYSLEVTLERKRPKTEIKTKARAKAKVTSSRRKRRR